MAILTVKARLTCDDCDEVFIVDLDPAVDATLHIKSLSDMIDDAVRNGACIVAGGSHLFEDCSMQDDRHLCPACTEALRAKESTHETD